MIKYLEFDSNGRCIGSHAFIEEPEIIPSGFVLCTDEHYANGADCSLVNGAIVLDATKGLAKDARARRNELLTVADLEINRLEDIGQSSAIWRAYRQNLRDVPQQPGFPTAITWPQVPA